MWFDAAGRRLPAPLFPGFDTVATLAHIGQSGYEHTWFVLNRRIIAGEFALSGSEQNPDITGKDVEATVRSRLLPEVPAPIQAFLDHGEDFVVAETLRELVAGMNSLTDEPLLDYERHRAPDRRARPRGGQPVRQGPPGDGDPRRPPLPA